MGVATPIAASPPPGRVELVPKWLDPELCVTPPDNPAYSHAMLADLIESFQQHGQLVPGWVSPHSVAGRMLCIEGNRRLAVARLLGLRFWAFDLGREVSEEERIVLTFNHNSTRRVMSREEIAEKAARYIDLTGCSQIEAATKLNVSGPTLSRAFGDRRIPDFLRSRAEKLGLSVRSLVAAVPVALMDQVIRYAETPGPDGKVPTRDHVSQFIARLKKTGTAKTPKPRTITLKHNGRVITLSIGGKDTPPGVVEELKSFVAKISKLADVSLDGWPFHFS
jgi:ParB/RepB/Spo0J family partition protein